MCCGVPYVNLLVCEFVNSYEALRDCEPVVNHRVNYFSPLDWPSINISLRGGCLMAVVKVKVGKHIKVLKWKQECVVSVGEERERERLMCGSVVWTSVDSLSFTPVLSFSDTNIADFVLHFHHPLQKKKRVHQFATKCKSNLLKSHVFSLLCPRGSYCSRCAL